MKYTCQIIIDKPLEEVIDKLDNADNMKHWQKGLQSYSFVSGTPGQEGAKMDLEYQMGKRHVKMTETITKNNFPNEFHANYDAKGVHNIQENYFTQLPNGSTEWRSVSIFKFSNFGLKLFGWLMPGVFKKQSMSYLQDFKAFAENGTSVAESQ
ncbi:MAG: SRPBCC family protein [Gilvibacter sp.]